MNVKLDGMYDSAQFIDSLGTIAEAEKLKTKECQPCGLSPITISRPSFTDIGHFSQREL
jgi:hypothetical protein